MTKQSIFVEYIDFVFCWNSHWQMNTTLFQIDQEKCKNY